MLLVNEKQSNKCIYNWKITRNNIELKWLNWEDDLYYALIK